MTITEMKKWKDRAKKCSEIYKNAGKDLDKAKVTIPVGAFDDLVNMAIKSHEAWEKVREEIKANNIEVNKIYTYQAIGIIDKHLAEVENGTTDKR